MNILFVNPCLRYGVGHRYLPVGLGYVVTSASEAGFDFDLLDIDLHQFDDEYVEEYVRTHRYDVIAFGCIVTHYRWVKWFADVVKQHQPDCRLVVGNSVGSSIPDLLFQNAPVDIVVLGEGDVTTVEVLKALEGEERLGDVEGIAFRDARGRVVRNAPRRARRKIDEFPYPNWDLFEVEQYLELGKSTAQDTTLYPVGDAVVMPVNTARGCVHKCTFCHHVFWNDPYRHRSVASIVGEIKRNKERYGANYINFWDELSFSKLDQAEALADALIAEDLGVHWTAAIRSDLFGRSDVPRDRRRSVAEKFVAAGALVVGYSLESANAEILKTMNKRVEAAHFAEQIELLSEVGLRSNTSLVIGCPNETLETLTETMQFCLDHRIYPSAGFLLPLPGTGMWEHAVKERYITDADSYLSTITERQDLVLNMTEIPDDVLVKSVEDWLQRLNAEMDLSLDPDKLIRTGGENRHTKGVAQSSRNSTESLSYAKVSGSL